MYGLTTEDWNVVASTIKEDFKQAVGFVRNFLESAPPTPAHFNSDAPAPAETPTPAATPASPEITPEELTGKTRTEIQDLAKEKGLLPKGDANSPDHPRKWSDPVTNKERLRLDRGHVDPKTGKPYNNPNAAGDHVHGYDKNGKPIEVNGDKHIPTTGSK